MARHKPSSILISLLIIGGIFFGMFFIAKSQKIERLRTSLKYVLEDIFYSFKESTFTSRRPPLTTIDLEESLKANLREPFGHFSPQEWRWFWNLIYGRHLDESKWPRTTRQLTREEVEYELTVSYQNPFNYFQDEQWDIFWRHILKGKVF
ncbi:MAG: hypothetical protein JW869_07570 [Candidatus Omnitrophica bacterium]|nr:hypothetical protein [Candidatus Omnitrophota bacterium]